ncbi:Transcription initiation factor TFIID subunit 9 [Sorochytrium milnesiophthora]
MDGGNNSTAPATRATTSGSSTSGSSSTLGTGSSDAKPRDAQLISLIMSAMGIHEADPRTLPMLLELAYRYVTLRYATLRYATLPPLDCYTSDILTDALTYAYHAGRADVSTDDVQLAIQARVNYSFTHPPPKDYLLRLAAEKNAVPMPMISDKYGVRLPPEQYCLTAVNYSAIPKPVQPTASMLGNYSAASTSAAAAAAANGALNGDDDGQHTTVSSITTSRSGSRRGNGHGVAAAAAATASDTAHRRDAQGDAIMADHLQTPDRSTLSSLSSSGSGHTDSAPGTAGGEALGEETDEELDEYISAAPLSSQDASTADEHVSPKR